MEDTALFQELLIILYLIHFSLTDSERLLDDYVTISDITKIYRELMTISGGKRIQKF